MNAESAENAEINFLGDPDERRARRDKPLCDRSSAKHAQADSLGGPGELRVLVYFSDASNSLACASCPDVGGAISTNFSRSAFPPTSSPACSFAKPR